MIRLENISKSYKDLKVLNNISYEFKSHKLYCIIGLSGAGKSTIIKILGLLTSYDEGSIYLNGRNLSNLSDAELSKIRNKSIGFVFRSFYLNPLLKAYENVILPTYLNNELSENQRKDKAYKLLVSLNMEDKALNYPKELSGGEEQRVAIARALINDPDIILADEPTGSLDSLNTKNIMKILKGYANNGKCVIVVTHDDKVLKYADVILNLADTKLSEVENEVL